MALTTGYLVVAVLATAPMPAVAQDTSEAVAELPMPTGPFPVGTTVAYLYDRNRTDQDFPSGRPVILQMWYPASNSTGTAARYLVEPGLAAALRHFEYYGIDSVTVARWARLPTHALVDAVPARGKHPLLAFSVGLGVIRANYTSLAEDLASHGYIVAMVESPLQGLLVLPGGRVITDSAGHYGEPAPHREGVASWARDISFALDQVTTTSAAPGVALVAATMDPGAIGAFGHSSGGLVAIAACEGDRRVRACVNMDGGLAAPDLQPLADFVNAGITKPALFLRSQPLYDDTTLTRRGMTREQWVKRGAAGRLAFDSLAARSPGLLWTVQVAGTGHFSFSDAPFTMPSAITRFGGRIIAAERGWSVITATLRTFFDRELKGQGDGIAALAARMPELTVTPPR